MNSSNNVRELCCVGDNCVDVYDNLRVSHAGGNCVNVAVSAAQAGCCSSYVGVVGSDAAGSDLLREVADRGVDVSHVRQVSGSTAVTHVQVVNGERVLGDYDEGVMTGFRLDDELITFLGGHRIVASALWGRIGDQLGLVRSKTTEIAFDCADEPYRPEAQAAIPHADICFFSADMDNDLVRRQMRDIAVQGPHMVIALLGALGSLAYVDGAMIACPAHAVDVIDAMGAGDSYIGAFLAARLRGESVLTCMEVGTASASHTLTVNGAW